MYAISSFKLDTILGKRLCLMLVHIILNMFNEMFPNQGIRSDNKTVESTAAIKVSDVRTGWFITWILKIRK